MRYRLNILRLLPCMHPRKMQEMAITRNFCFVIALLFVVPVSSRAQETVNLKEVKVLVYTKNGEGYVHDNIPFAVKCIQRLGQRYGFAVDTSADPSVMTRNNLRQYTLLIFPSTNNDVFDNNMQRLAFRHYIEAGGGFVGIHSVTGTERSWNWFKKMLGCTFAWHAPFQKFTVRVINSSHPSMQGVPKIWEKEDECYFGKELYPGPVALMAHDITSLNLSDSIQKNLVKINAGGYSEFYPAVWYHEYDGGHTWCTALGHDKKDYDDPTYVQHIFQGIKFIAGEVKKVDFEKAYANAWDAPLKY